MYVCDVVFCCCCCYIMYLLYRTTVVNDLKLSYGMMQKRKAHSSSIWMGSKSYNMSINTDDASICSVWKVSKRYCSDIPFYDSGFHLIRALSIRRGLECETCRPKEMIQESSIVHTHSCTYDTDFYSRAHPSHIHLIYFLQSNNYIQLPS